MFLISTPIIFGSACAKTPTTQTKYIQPGADILKISILIIICHTALTHVIEQTLREGRTMVEKYWYCSVV
jgi:hypothetical protein